MYLAIEDRIIGSIKGFDFRGYVFIRTSEEFWTSDEKLNHIAQTTDYLTMHRLEEMELFLTAISSRLQLLYKDALEQKANPSTHLIHRDNE